VLAVAVDMFTSHGVRRTSIEDVAMEAKVAKGSVYLEFRGKDELFRAVAERVVSEFVANAEAATAKDSALADRITEILAAKFWRLYDLVHARPHARELIETKDAVAADVFRAGDERFVRILDRTLVEAAERGQWRPRKPHTASAVVSVLLRAAHGNSYGGGRLTAAAFLRRLRLSVGVILDGTAQI
jgi:AcrR family transcriptional regulator